MFMLETSAQFTLVWFGWFCLVWFGCVNQAGNHKGPRTHLWVATWVAILQLCMVSKMRCVEFSARLSADRSHALATNWINFPLHRPASSPPSSPPC